MSRYIDADALKPDYIVASTSTGTDCDRYVSLKQIMNAPTADVRENVKARWITMSDADGVYYACSVCGEDIPRVSHFDIQFDLFPRLESINKTYFCPNCGAEMEKEKE